MYVITNRALIEDGQRGVRLGKNPNPRGANELQIVDATLDDDSNDYRAEVLDDELTKETVQSIKKKYRLDLSTRDTHHASLKVAADVFERARETKKSILVYVHGYNNDILDVLKTARSIEELYNVIVFPFSWPANGGGVVSGTASYLSDKQDARLSSGALNRFVGKLGDLHERFTAARRGKLETEAAKKFPDNQEAANAYFVEQLDDECHTSISLLCHSMGNYVFKYALLPSGGGSRELIFDNVALVAGDTNNEDHEKWVERIDARNRVYVVINENDFALKWSRRKPGSQQLARLGHYLRNLTARNARYIDVTSADAVNNSHGYFAGSIPKDNDRLRFLFQEITNGRVADDGLSYRADLNAYRLNRT